MEVRWSFRSEDAGEKKVAGKLRSSSKFYRFLWEIRGQLFDDDFQRELAKTYQPRGEEPCPPALLAMVNVLQAYTKLSDAAAVEAAEHDRRWQLVLGTLGEAAPFGQGSLVRFRVRMAEHGLDQKILTRTVELAKSTGAFGWKNLQVALDSSPLSGAGRVEDTWNLIGRALASVVRCVAAVTNIDEACIVEEVGTSVLKAPSIKAALDLDWGDSAARAAGLNLLIDQANALVSWIEENHSAVQAEPPLGQALEDLSTIIEQDTEPDPENDGRRRVRKGVAHDRVISLGDKEMRHGRKSKSKKINGYKRHVATVNGVIVSTVATPANQPEHEAAGVLLKGTKTHGDIVIIDIDRGYVASDDVLKERLSGVKVRTKSWPTNNTKNPDLFGKDQFKIDLQNQQVTCPSNQTRRIPTGLTVVFPTRICGACDIKEACTSGKNRTLQIHPQEEFQQQLRRSERTQEGRALLRERVVVEHSLARVGQIQGPRARYKGTRKNTLDLNRAATVANLQWLARNPSGPRRAA